MENESAADRRRRRRLVTAVKQSLRDLRIQLALLNHQVSTRAELRYVDLDCFDLVARHGPLGPSDLTRRAGLHPATVTGILDRLERGGWVVREPDPDDRRAVHVRVLRDRNAELAHLYAGMSSSMDRICSDYSARELELVATFLRRAAEAGDDATAALADR